jgi:SAM-dependent methyltransferase
LSPASFLEEWRSALESWALPQDFLARAPSSPWALPTDLFVARAARVLIDPPKRSAEIALDALPEGGSVLDVGAGAGAASLALASRAGRIVAVDQSEEMLTAFDELASRARVSHETVVGSWPDIAARVEPADVVVCNHVLYNVADLKAFARALDEHARRRVVCEITPQHPRAWLNALWMQLHGIDRPDRPTAEDADAALRELGFDVHREDFSYPPAAEGLSREQALARVRSSVALGPDRDDELVEALGDRLRPLGDGWTAGPLEHRLVTLWWDAPR